MNVTTLNKDILKVKTYLNNNDKKGLENMLETFINSYKITIYLRLDPFDKKKWNDLLFS